MTNDHANETGEALLERIRQSVIGDDHLIDGPFGKRRLIYADYTASGRGVGFIEDFIRTTVLPLYANTHTETSYTGLCTTHMRESARATIRAAVGATDDHAVIFCGAGATGAVNRLIDIMNIRIPRELEARYSLSDAIPEEDRPVIFIGPYEHHSNELPWRETIADVVPINEDADGRIDLAHLQSMLERYSNRAVKIGSFSAASNVTGVISDTVAITRTLHDHGALSFWDYAAAGPYKPIDVSGTGHNDHKDAVFLSPHKFVGGPGSPGVLVVDKALLHNPVPARPGGGTVSYVNPVEHRYIDDKEHREEGGTPAIVESVRAGLAFRLKEAVGTDLIGAREEAFVKRALASWGADPNIDILGNPSLPRLGIISFVIRDGKLNLHHDFVVALLNDLFGIQARGGCSCAGPYGHRLLGIGLDQSRAFEQAIVSGCNVVKPGWIRVGFNFFFSDTVADYIIKAVHFIAEHGWKFLPLYSFDAPSGVWRHRNAQGMKVKGLADCDMFADAPVQKCETASESILADHLEEAAHIAAALHGEAAVDDPVLPADVEALRWFELPSEVAKRSKV